MTTATPKAIRGLMDDNGLGYEQAYGVAWRVHRKAVDGWDGQTWSGQGYNDHISDKVRARIVTALRDMPAYSGDVTADAKTISSCVTRGFCVAGHRRGQERYLVLTEAGERFLADNDVQRRLF